MSSNGSLRPLYIQVHARDNVAIVANEGGLPSGAQFDSGLTLLEAIPEAHKVALSAHCAQASRSFAMASVIGYAEGADRTRQLGARGSDEFARGPAAR